MHRLISNRKRTYLIGALTLAFSLTISSLVYASTTSNLLPLADGNYSQWTPSTGTSHFALVNELACNGTANYNSTTVVGNRDSYVVATSTIPVGATITQVAIRPCASRSATGGGSSVLNVFYRFGGANSSDSGAYALSGTTPTDLATTTFSGLTLLNFSTSTIEIGGVLTSSTKGARLSRIATIVTYSPHLSSLLRGLRELQRRPLLFKSVGRTIMQPMY